MPSLKVSHPSSISIPGNSVLKLDCRFIGEESDVYEPLTDEPTFICDPIDGSVSSMAVHDCMADQLTVP